MYCFLTFVPQARASLVNRDERLEALYDELERDLHIIGGKIMLPHTYMALAVECSKVYVFALFCVRVRFVYVYIFSCACERS